MRNVIFYDPIIPKVELFVVLMEYSKFHRDNSGVVFSYDLIPFDFRDYPTYSDADGDQRPTEAFLKKLTGQVTKEYGQFGTDNVKLLIHENNWKSDPPGPNNGIWGTNWSYVYGTFHVQYCRWDADNPANTFGTLNHEDDHTYDALCQVELGIDIRPILGVSNYDKQTTHGAQPAYHGYIRYKENAEKLRVLAPYLQAAYTKRLERHRATKMGQITSIQKSIISLLEKLKYQLDMKFNRKDGVPKNNL